MASAHPRMSRVGSGLWIALKASDVMKEINLLDSLDKTIELEKFNFNFVFCFNMTKEF